MILNHIQSPVTNLSSVEDILAWIEQLKTLEVDDAVVFELERAEWCLAEARKLGQSPFNKDGSLRPRPDGDKGT